MTDDAIPEDVDLTEFLTDARTVLRTMIQEDRTIGELAIDIDISEPALKKFLYTTVDKPRRKSQTYAKIHGFLRREFGERGLDDPSLAGIKALTENLVPQRVAEKGEFEKETYNKLTANSYSLILQMLQAERVTVEKMEHRFAGNYACFRPSMISERVHVSSLVIRQKPSFSRVWEYQHIQTDSVGEKRSSDGPTLYLSDNIYLIGDIENGAGLELMIFKDPITTKFSFLRGLFVSLNYNRQPFVTRIFARPLRDEEDKSIYEQGVKKRSSLGERDKEMVDYIMTPSSKHIWTIDDRE